jgi:hypothetical protein
MPYVDATTLKYRRLDTIQICPLSVSNGLFAIEVLSPWLFGESTVAEVATVNSYVHIFTGV